MTNFARLALALLLTVAFLLLAATGGPSSGWDPAVAARFGQLRVDAPEVVWWAALFTAVGGAPVTLGAALIATLWLLAKRLKGKALLLTATVLAERLLVELLKEGFGRPRPQVEHLPTSLAFPSGHAANSMTTYLALALIAASTRYRRTAIMLAIAITLAVGLTRLVLGVHWASDVIGGWIFGLLAVGLAETIGERSGALRLEAKHDIVARHGATFDRDETA